MTIGFIFWLLMLLAIIFHVAGYWGPYAGNPNVPRFNAIWLFILLFLLGWAVFGFAIQGAWHQVMSEAPEEMWVRPWAGGWYETQFRDEAAAVRYVRADLYEAALARLWTRDVPCLEPLKSAGEADYR